MSERMSENMPERMSELKASGRGFSHGHWELWGVDVAVQSAIENLHISPGQMVAVEEATGRRRKKRRKEEEEEMRLTT